MSDRKDISRDKRQDFRLKLKEQRRNNTRLSLHDCETLIISAPPSLHPEKPTILFDVSNNKARKGYSINHEDLARRERLGNSSAAHGIVPLAVFDQTFSFSFSFFFIFKFNSPS